MGKKKQSGDSKAKAALRDWPSTTEVWAGRGLTGNWLRAQPKQKEPGPTLKSAGSTGLTTQPDGLWVNLHRGTELFADCIVIEACGTFQNLQDKRSRYQPSITARVLVCGRAWLQGEVNYKRGTRCRWELADKNAKEPAGEEHYPVRYLTVLFFLKDDRYEEWTTSQIPAPHEYFARYASLESFKSGPMQEFLKRMSPATHLYTTSKKKKTSKAGKQVGE